jgi:hypothetical protein
MEFGGVDKVHVFWLWWVIDGGQSQASESVTTSSVQFGKLEDLGQDGFRHWHLLGSDSDVRAPVQNTLWGTLNEHLGSVSNSAGLQWSTV